MLKESYEVRCGMCNKAMTQLIKQTPTTMTKALSPKQKVQKLMIESGGGWYMEHFLRECHHLGDQNQVKKHKNTRMIIKNKYIKVLISGMIGNSN